MRSQSFYLSSSRKRLEDFRTKLESSLNSKQSNSNKTVQTTIRKPSPSLRFKELADEIYRSVTPKREESPVLMHYKSLSYFKSQNSSPKAGAKPSVDLSKKIGFSYNLDANLYGDKKKEKLSDLISIEALSAATSIINRGGINSIPKVYAAQLKEFCTEVLANIR